MASRFVALSLIASSLAAVHEQLSNIPHGWRNSPRTVSGDNVLQLHVALAYSNLDLVESKLKEVSTPGSPNYGQYLDIDDIEKLFRPSAESASAVTAWLHENGAETITADTNGHTISFSITVDAANKMLNTSFELYTNDYEEKLRTSQYSLPDELLQYIDFISPTIYFGSAEPQRATPRQDTATGVQDWRSTCKIEITETADNTTKVYDGFLPHCLQRLYNTEGYQPNASCGSTIAFGNFFNQSVNYTDYAQWQKLYNISSSEFKVLALLNGATDDQDPATTFIYEANMDLYGIAALAEGLPIGAYNTRGMAPFVPTLLAPNITEAGNEPYLQFYNYLLSQPNSNLPYVISNSYAEAEISVPQYYAKRVCNMIGMMGLRGRTILAPSGNGGPGSLCLSSPFSGPPKFDPRFPSTCPYVTTVGGTTELDVPEAWNSSGGGFSEYFPRPWYQEATVQTYLDEYLEAKEYYSTNNYTNFAGRGYPDVSAHAFAPFFPSLEAGVVTRGGGTSLATPIVGAVIALLNDARLRAGKPVMGFINPWLFSVGKDTLVDITKGGSVGCDGSRGNGTGVIPYAGWNATVGWDPVTGLGYPDFQKMKEAALSG